MHPQKTDNPTTQSIDDGPTHQIAHKRIANLTKITKSATSVADAHTPSDDGGTPTPEMMSTRTPITNYQIFVTTPSLSDLVTADLDRRWLCARLQSDRDIGYW